MSDLARDLGQQENWVSRRVGQNERPSKFDLDELEAMSNALDVPVSRFFEEDR